MDLRSYIVFIFDYCEMYLNIAYIFSAISIVHAYFFTKYVILLVIEIASVSVCVYSFVKHSKLPVCINRY